jgi:hypothetical protein
VTSLVALAALDTLGGAGLRALLRLMTLLLAVLAGVGVEASLGAVAGAVAFLLAVDARDGGLVGLVLDYLLLAVLKLMSAYDSRRSKMTLKDFVSLTFLVWPS